LSTTESTIGTKKNRRKRTIFISFSFSLIELFPFRSPPSNQKRREGRRTKSTMKRSLIIVFLLSIGTVAEEMKCTEDGVETTDRCVSTKACPVNDETRNKTSEMIGRSFPRFDQMHNLRIIGGACVTHGEVTEAYLKLIYIYSSIFPIILNIPLKELSFDTSYITFGQILELDKQMQDLGRVHLHRLENTDPELIRRKVDDFFISLMLRNDYKEYRRYHQEKNTTSFANN
ncbi:hypothetical protein PFISCL1PPCAC_26371, partial [Pristionchus fissidentatus]